MVRPVICSAFDVISGHTSTPTRSPFAVRKGLLLKLGSSAIDRSLALSEPEKMDMLKSPTCTLRPRASESLASTVGRKELALMNKGIKSSMRMSAPIAIKTQRTTFFLSPISITNPPLNNRMQNSLLYFAPRPKQLDTGSSDRTGLHLVSSSKIVKPFVFGNYENLSLLL